MILYLSHSRLQNSVNSVYINGLLKAGEDVKSFKIPKSFSGYLNVLKMVKERNPQIIMVGYDSPQLVTFCKLFTPLLLLRAGFTGKKIVYNALCSVYERLVVSRDLASRLSPKSAYYWFIDFAAVHLADLVMVETDSQKNYFQKLFKVKRNKLFRAWTGADERIFFHDPAIKKFPVFTVLFRGALMPESGAEYVVQAAKILEDEDLEFIMQSGGIGLDRINNLIRKLKPKKLNLRSDFMPEGELRVIMQSSHILLGQLSDHSRVERTIPHKAYEALALGVPYLTAANKGVLELLKAGDTCITCEPANAESLAEKILWVKNNPREIEKVAENGYRLFRNELTVEKLGRMLKSRLDKLFV